MDHTLLWSLIPGITAVLFALSLLFLSRRHQWTESETLASLPQVATADKQTGIFKSRFNLFIFTRRWEVLLAMVFLGLTIFAALSAPVQLTGEIPNVPNMPGRPFYFIHWQRNHLFLFYNQTAIASNILTGALALALSIYAAIRKSPQKVQTSLLWGFMSLAGSAQWMVSNDAQRSIGLAVYLLAGAGFLIWSILNLGTLQTDIDEPRRIPYHWEVVLVVAIVALSAFGRMYALTSIPYGIEGDEAKWTAEVVWLGLRGEPDTNGMYHRDSLPVSFFIQTVFHKVMGPSLFTARFEVALFSVIATLIFYLFLRQLTATPLALLASWLLSASIFDISASRLANVESHVKIWPILTLALFAWALQKRHWATYTLAGVALALGLLTYDTVLPMGIVMVILMIVEARRQSQTLADTMRNLMALITPALLTLPFLIPYLSGRLSYYNVDGKGWDNGTATLLNHFTDIIVSWYVRPFEDFLYNRNGPLLNAFLLPWLTFGFTASVAAGRRRLPFWTLTWLLLFILPVPIATHTPLGRVYYPALPAAYILAAIGLYVFTRESLRALGNDFRPLVTAVSVAVLVWLPLFNLYIYFNEVYDFSDRQMRREVAELTGEVAGPENLIVLASVPGANEPLNNEYQMIELFMMDKLPIEYVAMSYKNVPLEDVLPTLHSISPHPNRSIILDKFTQNDRQKRDNLNAALHKCYPHAAWTEGKFFDRVDIDSQSLLNPACVSTVISLQQTSVDTFSWSLSQGLVNQIDLKCDLLRVDRNWIEAETLSPSTGWQMETSYVAEWSDKGFMMDHYGSSPLYFDVIKEESRPIYFWVRYYKRVVDTSPAELTFNGQIKTFSDISKDKTNQWVWEKVGPFTAPAGNYIATLNRPYKDEPSQFIALFVDVIVYTPDPGFSPTAEHFETLPPRTFNFQNQRNEGVITARFEPGSYRCHAEVSNKDYLLVDAFGFSPVKSGIIEFTIK